MAGGWGQLKNLHHPNLVRFYTACTAPTDLCIVTELCAGSLRDLLYGSKSRAPNGGGGGGGGWRHEMTTTRTLAILQQVARGRLAALAAAAAATAHHTPCSPCRLGGHCCAPGQIGRDCGADRCCRRLRA